jgi:amidohydrolase
MIVAAVTVQAQSIDNQRDMVAAAADKLEAKVIAWRRDIHQNPELGNREFRTAKLVADHLTGLGLEVKTGVAHTGVVGLLKGAKPSPLVALRADMDALPVTELADLPFASKAKTMWRGQETGVMHACGHDGHTAFLMGVVELLAGLKDKILGSVMFIFQPAEEGAPPGEEGGAKLMVKQGVLADPVPEAIFGLHLTSSAPLGMLGYRIGPMLASSDGFSITVHGRGTHGARPWAGVDPIVVAAQIVIGLQTIASRQVDVTREPSVITVGSIQGGNRGNIIPESVTMTGTIRTFNEEMREDIHRRVRQTAQSIAESAGATVTVGLGRGYDVTANPEALGLRAVGSLRQSVGAENVREWPKSTGAEDFSAFQKEVPGFFFNLGARPANLPREKIGANHSPYFIIDEAALTIGVKALANLALDQLAGR